MSYKVLRNSTPPSNNNQIKVIEVIDYKSLWRNCGTTTLSFAQVCIWVRSRTVHDFLSVLIVRGIVVIIYTRARREWKVVYTQFNGVVSTGRAMNINEIKTKQENNCVCAGGFRHTLNVVRICGEMRTSFSITIHFCRRCQSPHMHNTNLRGGYKTISRRSLQLSITRWNANQAAHNYRLGLSFLHELHTRSHLVPRGWLNRDLNYEQFSPWRSAAAVVALRVCVFSGGRAPVISNTGSCLISI